MPSSHLIELPSGRILVVREMAGKHAHAILSWQYDAPYDIYNIPPERHPKSLQGLLDPELCYYSICINTGELMAFCCFGADAQVPGGDYSKHALDIGLGLRPDLTGLGHGLDYVRTVIEFGIMRFKPDILRATIASFNLRAQKVWIASGFSECQRFERESDDLEFVVLELLCTSV